MDIRTSDLAELTGIAKLLASSGYFDAKGTADQAVAQLATKILAGRELGLGPFAAVQGIHVIQGRPAISANLIASAIKASPKYDYRVKTLTNELCEIEFLERNGRLESLGVSSFTSADARAAGTQNMNKFPRNMLFARAISNGARWYCPDLFNGNAVYVPEELGAIVDGEGNVIDQPSSRRQLAAPAPAPEPADVPAEVGIWASPTDAYQWAVDIGAWGTVDDARAAFSKLVQIQFGGKLTAGNKTTAFAAFYADCLDKLSIANIDLVAVEEIAH